MRQAVAWPAVVFTPCIFSAASPARPPSEGDPLPKRLSIDPTYGFTEKNPIKVGRKHGGPEDEEMYLGLLAGPNGEAITYQRLGSCCRFQTPNGEVGGMGLLDRYEVKYSGLMKPLVLYLNMYDYEQPLVPIGLTLKK